MEHELPTGLRYTIGEKEFYFSVATTALELTRGLKGMTAETLAPFDGMLFDFIRAEKIIMTPRGCLMSLELAFIDEDGVIVEITKLDPWLGYTQAASSPVRYALEVPVGFFKRHGIKLGDQLI